MGSRTGRLLIVIVPLGFLAVSFLILFDAFDLRARLGPSRGRDVNRAIASYESKLAGLRGATNFLLVGAGALMVGLVVVGVSILRRRGRNESEPALQAYEHAMERLRDQRQQLAALHQSQLQRLSEALADKETMARAGALTAGMAHEVRNSLNTIKGYAQLLEQEQQQAAAAAATAAILQECETLQSAVLAFVDFIKREELTLEPTSLRSMLRRITTREEHARAGARVSLREDLPETTVHVDADLLARAFENLIRNGREAAGAQGHVDVSWFEEPGRVVVMILDDGPGLPPGIPPGQPFATSKPGGLGLGLATAMKIVGLHQGTLSLENRAEGQGCCARVELPREPPA